MALEVTAKLIKVFPVKTGDGRNGQWTKQDFLVETQETYPKKMYFSAWGDKAEGISKMTIGSTVKVSFFVESREFNEKWYTDMKVWKVEKLIYQDANAVQSTEQEQSEEPVINKDEDDNLPF